MVNRCEQLPEGLNSHVVGLTCKEMVRRAIRAILKERLIFEVTRKEDKGDRPDFLTSADRAAQAIYVKLIKECFPGFGTVAEEDHLSVPCTVPGLDAYFTVDPLDGTKAFMRRQSHGIGTMLSLVVNDEIAAAFVGDVMTGEIYYYRPCSDTVHRLFGFDEAEDLAINPALPLAEQYLLLRDPPDRCGPTVQAMAGRPSKGGLFRNVEVGGGSIGISMARLWKGEVGGVVLDPVNQTPWDYCPVWGISKKLGFVFVAIHNPALCPIEIKPIREMTDRTYEVLIIHESRLEELDDWSRKYYK